MSARGWFKLSGASALMSCAFGAVDFARGHYSDMFLDVVCALLGLYSLNYWRRFT